MPFLTLLHCSIRFGNLLPFSEARELDMLQDEFVSYQLLSQDDIPAHVWKEASVSATEEGSSPTRIDVIWQHLSERKGCDGTHTFLRLSRVAKLALIIPHSNAGEERVFSIIRKNKTAYRPSLDPKGTLSSIMKIKLADLQPAHSIRPPPELLRKAKSATWEYNKAHSKKN